MKKRIRVSQLMAQMKAGGSVMDEHKVVPSSLPENRYPCPPIRDSVNTLTICPVKDYVFYTLSVEAELR
jgi:hypothetical protein